MVLLSFAAPIEGPANVIGLAVFWVMLFANTK